MRAVGALFGREMALAWGKGGGPMMALPFYLIIATLLPFAIGPDRELLAPIATGSSWLALALASLLSLERLFERDFDDGGLDLLSLGGPPMELVCFIKCLAQWLTTGLPLALAAPVISIALGADPSLAPLIFATALLGGLGFAFIGGVGAALAIGSRRGGVLIAVIVLPLFVPPVIFGAGTIDAAADGIDWRSGFLFLGGFSLTAVALSPIAMAAAVRNALS